MVLSIKKFNLNKKTVKYLNDALVFKFHNAVECYDCLLINPIMTHITNTIKPKFTIN